MNAPQPKPELAAAIAGGAEPSLVDRIARLERRVDRLPDPNNLTLLVFSGDLDRLMAAFTIASGAAATSAPLSAKEARWKKLDETAIGRLLGEVSPDFNRTPACSPVIFHNLHESQADRRADASWRAATAPARMDRS